MKRTFRYFITVFILALPASAAEIEGIVANLTDEGHLNLHDGTVVLPWGLIIPKTVAADALLEGKRIRCRTMKTLETMVLADCLIAPSEKPPHIASEYLDMFTWLPSMVGAARTCDPFELYAPHTIWVRGVGQLAFGCRSGVPMRGVTLHEF